MQGTSFVSFCSSIGYEFNTSCCLSLLYIPIIDASDVVVIPYVVMLLCLYYGYVSILSRSQHDII